MKDFVVCLFLLFSFISLFSQENPFETNPSLSDESKLLFGLLQYQDSESLDSWGNNDKIINTLETIFIKGNLKNLAEENITLEPVFPQHLFLLKNIVFSPIPKEKKATFSFSFVVGPQYDQKNISFPIHVKKAGNILKTLIFEAPFCKVDISHRYESETIKYFNSFAQKQIDSQMNELQENIQKKHEAFLFTLTKESVNRLDQLSENIQKKYQERLDATLSIIEKKFSELELATKSILENANKKLNRNVELGEIAYKMGNQVKDKNVGLAKIFYLNAVNHDPENIEYLKKYVDLVHSSQINLDELKRLRSVLEVVLYQVSAQNISQVLEFLQKNEVIQEDLLTKMENIKEEKVDWKKKILELKKKDLSSICGDSNMMEQHILEWQELYTELSESSHTEDRYLADEAKMALEKILTIARVNKFCLYIDSCLEKLSSEELKNGGEIFLESEEAVSRIQAAENILPQIWGENINILPDFLKSKIEKYPIEIKKWINEIAKAKSKKLVNTIKKARDTCERIKIKTLVEDQKTSSDKTKDQKVTPNGKIQKIISQVKYQLNECQIAYIQISSIEKKKDASDDIAEMQKILVDYQKEQYNRYQRWVLQGCKNAFSEYHQETIKVSDKDRDRILNNWKPYEVNEALLSRETSRVFQDVLQKLLAEFNAKDMVEYQKKLSESQKKSLEDF